jgi:riboflavin biosynthesis pyrimidine reductase
VFRTLRAAADVVVAAAGTVRAERYRPIQEPRPTPIAVVSRSLELEWDAPLFTDAPARTIVLTCEGADPGARRHAATLADVVVAGGDVVDLGLAMAALADRGHHVALCEGGPRLLAQVAAAGALDELCLTLSPVLAAGRAPRILDGGDLPAPSRLALASVLEDDGFLLLRYLVAAGVPGDDGT